MAKLKLDLHDIYNRGDRIEAELNNIIEEAMGKRISLVEIIPGKGSGQLKKKSVALSEPAPHPRPITALTKIARIMGASFVHFRHK